MITALTDPGQLPNQLQDQQTFDANMAYVIDMLPERARQENELAANMSMFAAGGAYAFPYVFDSSTADADPGVGKLRLSSATQNAASIVMRMDLQAVGGADMTNVLADLRAATSAVKGSVRLVKMTDPSKWLIYDVTAVAIPTGYRNLTMTWRATGGGQASPFANGDALMVYIDRNGDAGTQVGMTQLIAEQVVTTGVSAIVFQDVFTDTYDWYLIDVQNVISTSDSLSQLRLYASGTPAGGTYFFGSPSSSSLSANSYADLGIGNGGTISGLAQVRGVRRAGQLKSLTWDGRNRTSAGAIFSSANRGELANTAVMSGFAINAAAGGLLTGTVRVYGVGK